MKALGITCTAILSLLLAVAAPAWAQEHEQEQKDRPTQQEENKAQPEKSVKQDQKPAAQQEKNAKSEEKKVVSDTTEKNVQQQEKTAKPEEKNTQQHAVQAQPAKQAQHASGGRIPDDRFKANFGKQHTFRVSQDNYRNRRFQYGGYSFGFVDLWPSNWLYTQNVYVIEIDGVYYLCNPTYPGVNIALSVVL